MHDTLKFHVAGQEMSGILRGWALENAVYYTSNILFSEFRDLNLNSGLPFTLAYAPPFLFLLQLNL